MLMSQRKTYDIAISFTEKYRSEANLIAQKLKQKGYIVYFYPQTIDDDIGADMHERLTYIYQYQSSHVITLISVDYFEKSWTKIEWEAIQKRSIKEKEEYGNQAGFSVIVMMEDFKNIELKSSLVYYKWDGDVKRFYKNIKGKLTKRKKNKPKVSKYNIDNTKAKIGHQFVGNKIDKLNINSK